MPAERTGQVYSFAFRMMKAPRNCVQACNDVQVNQAISFGYRGTDTKIVTCGDLPLVNSDCVFCGECVQVCPTSALVEKKARSVWRPWDTKKIRTSCARSINEDSYNMQKLFRAVIGTNNIDHCART